MTKRLTFAMCLAIALGAVGCQDPATDPMTSSTTQPELRKQTPPGRDLSQQNGLTLPRSGRVMDLAVPRVSREAIDPDDYVCQPLTPVISIFLDEFNEFVVEEPERFNLFFNILWADLIPTYESFLILTDETPQVFGYDGEYTHVLQKTDRDSKRFWDIVSDQIQMVALKGTMLQDEARTAAAYQLPIGPPEPYGLTADSAAKVAALIHQELLASQVLDGGNHSLFSFNAFAFWTDDGSLPEKIVMGDAIMDAYAQLGFGDVAPQAIYAHEFGHHIQHLNGYFEELPPGPPPTTQAEFTRYTELMADAYSAYYLTHKRGAAMNKHRVAEFLEVFFQIGDCAFFSPGHHGTPNQRMRSAQFGFDVADQAHKQGHILTSDQFHDLFVDAYLEIVAPDA